MAEAVGTPATDKQSAGSENGTLILLVVGVALVVLLAVLPWSVLAAVALGVGGILWHSSKEDAAAPLGDASSAGGDAKAEKKDDQVGLLLSGLKGYE